MELEVDKWYVFYYNNEKSILNTYYFKYLKKEGTLYYSSEYVNSNIHYNTIAAICYTSDINKIFEVLDLSILKDVLPKDYFKDIIHEIW